LVIDGTTRARLFAENSKSVEIIKPFLRGRDIKRWQTEHRDLWLLFIPWHFPLQDSPGIAGACTEAECAFRKEYPAVYQHLFQYKAELSVRDKSETGLKYEWYALARYREYWREFLKPKIFFPAIKQRRPFRATHQRPRLRVVRLFDACEKAGVGKLASLKDKALATAANELTGRIFATSHSIYPMLFNLQALDVVRIIEGRE